MKQTNLDNILWVVQTQLEEQVLKPLEKLLHNSAEKNTRFFSGVSRPIEKNNLATNLEVILALIRAVQDCQTCVALDEKEAVSNEKISSLNETTNLSK